MSIEAIQNPIFQPALRIIQSIDNGLITTVTTTFPHLYVSGTIVRLIIPNGFGMLQANKLFSPIIVTGDTTFTMDINSLNFDTFAYPTGLPYNRQFPQVNAIGEINSTLKAVFRNVLPLPAS